MEWTCGAGSGRAVTSSGTISLAASKSCGSASLSAASAALADAADCVASASVVTSIASTMSLRTISTLTASVATAMAPGASLCQFNAAAITTPCNAIETIPMTNDSPAFLSGPRSPGSVANKSVIGAPIGSGQLQRRGSAWPGFRCLSPLQLLVEGDKPGLTPWLPRLTEDPSAGRRRPKDPQFRNPGRSGTPRPEGFRP